MNKLKEYRLEKRYSRREVAEICGVHLNSIERYEHGTRTPLPQHVKRLTKFYRLSDNLQPFNIGIVDRDVVDYGLIVQEFIK